MKKIFFIISMLILAGTAQALQTPRPLATDSRIQIVRYNQNEVFKFIGHYGYQSLIEFAAGEKIGTVSIGDSTAWQISPVDNRLFLKPVEQDAATNMTVITNQHIYNFELHAADASDARDKEMIFVLRFVYPSETGDGGLARTVIAKGVPDISDPEERKRLNLKYSIVGPDAISPIRVFDDGEFTYFQFKDKNAEVPAFFLVDAAGNEAIINFRAEGDYIVIERVSARMTLRRGSDILCVFNDTMKPAPISPPEKQGFFSNLRFWGF